MASYTMPMPGAPVITSVQACNAGCSVAFAPPSYMGRGPILSYAFSASSANANVITTTAESPLRFTGLANGTTYNIGVVASNAGGLGPWASGMVSVTPFTVPNAPAIRGVSVVNASLVVAFAPSAVTGGAAITGYQATAVDQGGSVAATSGIALASPLVISGIASSTYTCTVRACNAAGASAPSAPSAPMYVAGLATAPQAFCVLSNTTTPSNLYVCFTTPAFTGNPVTAYIAVAQPGGASGASATSPITIAGVNPALTYTVSAFALTVAGQGTPATTSTRVPLLYNFAPPFAFTFTTAGVGGPNGPNLAQCKSAYSAATWTTSTAYFNMVTNGVQQWTVPATATYSFVVAGAQGGTNTWQGGCVGGYGAVITVAALALNGGDKLNLVVGQTGVLGGSGYANGGGGGTFVFDAAWNVLFAAGGGGGSTRFNRVSDGLSGVASASVLVNASFTSNANVGQVGNTNANAPVGGTGGTERAGGTGGQNGSLNANGTTGANGVGGTGTVGYPATNSGGGGGGGGSLNPATSSWIGGPSVGGSYGNGGDGGFGGGASGGGTYAVGGGGGGGGYSGGGGGGATQNAGFGVSRGGGGGGGSLSTVPVSAWSYNGTPSWAVAGYHGFITVAIV